MRNLPPGANKTPLTREETLMTDQPTPTSVQPEWCTSLPVQQQSVLLLAARGPDGVRKHHECKALIRAYRSCVLRAASLRRTLTPDDPGDSFMDAGLLSGEHTARFYEAVGHYLRSVDELPLHYHLHFLHGAQILGYKHPDPYVRERWATFYLLACEDLHLTPESRPDMDARLNDVFE